jgi:hypothetical protein
MLFGAKTSLRKGVPYMLARVLAFHLWLPNNHAMQALYISESESICSVSLASMNMYLNLAFYKSITLLLIS